MKKIALFLVIALFSLAGLLASLPTNAAGNNLVPNPSVETASGSNPAEWSTVKTGNNKTSFSYLDSGRTGNHSLYVNMSQRSSGHAGWCFTQISVLPNTTYTYTDWYQSNIQTYIRGEITRTNNRTSNLKAVGVPASTTWRQATVSIKTPANAKALTIYHFINKKGHLATDDFNLEAPVLVAPNVAITAPTAGSNISGTTSVSATANGGSWPVKNVQFKLDGVNLGSPDTTAPYSVSWNTKNNTNGSHSLTAVVTNTNNMTAESTVNVITVNNPTAPTVAITNPVANATVSGSQTVTATAADGQGIKSVQFKLDGANLGSADTTAPYETSWNTANSSNGNHLLSAVVTNLADMTTTAANISVAVNNAVVIPPAATNLIPNSSLEAASGDAPASWLSSYWGSNTSTFSYLNTGRTGNRSIKVETTAYTSGAANWYYADVPVIANKAYKYENWYQSNVDTEVDAEVIMADGSVQYFWLGTVPASTSWTKFSTVFTVPSGGQKMAIFQILAKKGYVVSDDYSLSEYTPQAWNRALVSVTFDDGWASQYNNALPILNKYGLKGTFYIISGELSDQPDYMTSSQVNNLHLQGMEIGSHTVSHVDLTQASQATLVNQMSQSQLVLQNTIGAPVTNLAYPYGAYNANTIAVGQQYYQSQRSVNRGYNTKDNMDVTQLKIYEVDSDISNAQVEAWIQGAIEQKAWLILVYHEVGMSIGGDIYHVSTANLDSQMNYLKNSGVQVVTVNQALNELAPQL